jgi:hypothetical protein
VARANQIRVALALHRSRSDPAGGARRTGAGGDDATSRPRSRRAVAPRNQTAQYFEFDPNASLRSALKDNAAGCAAERIDAAKSMRPGCLPRKSWRWRCIPAPAAR